jgi:hypothetical protein
MKLHETQHDTHLPTSIFMCNCSLHAGYVGLDTFTYTTDNSGIAKVTVNVTVGSCKVNMCKTISVNNTCKGGRCICAANSGLSMAYLVNTDSKTKDVQRFISSCRYRRFVPIEGFTPSKLMTVNTTAKWRISFILAANVASAKCFGVDPLAGVTLGKLNACPKKVVGGATDVDSVEASSGTTGGPAFTNAAPMTSLSSPTTCSNGVYTTLVSVSGTPGVCYSLVLKLEDGTIKRSTIKIAP